LLLRRLGRVLRVFGAGAGRATQGQKRHSQSHLTPHRETKSHDVLLRLPRDPLGRGFPFKIATAGRRCQQKEIRANHNPDSIA
jgi:hypothetical protein